MNAIQITYRNMTCKYIDFIVTSDPDNLYRYEEVTGKIRKILGFGRGNFGKAIRGNARQKVEEIAKIAYNNMLPFAMFEA